MKMLNVNEFSKVTSILNSNNDQLESYIREISILLDNIRSSLSGNDLSFLSKNNNLYLDNFKKIVKSNDNYYSNLIKVRKSYEEQSSQISSDMKRISVLTEEKIK